MKHKYAIPVELKELDELLESNKNEKVWEQKVTSKWVYVSLFNQLIVVGLFIFFLKDIHNALYSTLFLLASCYTIFLSKSMKYTIMPHEIKFEWGIFYRKKVTIPFSDMTAINLVKYNNSKHSTIFFGTNNTYKTRKKNIDTNEPRSQITFENVKDGDKVNELLHLLWQRNLQKEKGA